MIFNDVCVCVYVCMYVCVCVCVCSFVYFYVCMFVCGCKHECKHTNAFADIFYKQYFMHWHGEINYQFYRKMHLFNLLRYFTRLHIRDCVDLKRQNKWILSGTGVYFKIEKITQLEIDHKTWLLKIHNVSLA